MRVVELRLWNLRNYGEAVFRPAPGLTAVTGPNGAGKSSLLEALSYFATLSTPRAGTASVLVRDGCDEGGAKLEGDEGVPLEFRIRGGRTLLRAGGSGTQSKAFIGRFRSVLFTPEDLDLVRGEPELRRRTLDELLIQLRPAYRGVRQDFDRALRQRNAALRDGRHREAALYSAPLAAAAAQVISARRDAVEALAPVCEQLYAELATRGKLRLAYIDHSGTQGREGDDLVAWLRTLYDDYLERDLERGRTSVGAHRDDVEVEIDGRPARTHASRGEQRSAALAFRLGELTLLPDAVLLLDDVLSELDPDRRRRVFSVASGRQTVLTATEPEVLAPAGVDARWTVDDGTLRHAG